MILQPQSRENAGMRAKVFVPAALSLCVIGLSIMGRAETPKADMCTMSLQSGSISAPAASVSGGLRLETPLPEKDRYLRILLPSSYLAKVTKAALGMPETDRAPFIRGVVSRNIMAAHEAPKKSFPCAPLSEPPQGSAGPAPAPAPSTSSAKTEAAPSASSASKEEPPPKEAADAGTQSRRMHF